MASPEASRGNCLPYVLAPPSLSCESEDKYRDKIKIKNEKKSSDIYEALNSVVSEFGGFKKCPCIVIDGAKAMVGSKTGLVGLLRANGINCITLHCVIHQEALCGKVL